MTDRSNLFKLVMPDGTLEYRLLVDFFDGPFSWDARTRHIIDRDGLIRFGYLDPIPTDRVDAFLQQLNDYHALWLLTRQSHNSDSE